MQLLNDCAAGQVAHRFAAALADEKFDAAHSMLSSDTRYKLSASELERQYHEMIEYGDGPAHAVKVMMVQDTWPSQRPGDLAWVYVAILGPGFSEAVTVAVVDEETETKIRVLDWRRP